MPKICNCFISPLTAVGLTHIVISSAWKNRHNCLEHSNSVYYFSACRDWKQKPTIVYCLRLRSLPSCATSAVNKTASPHKKREAPHDASRFALLTNERLPSPVLR